MELQIGAIWALETVMLAFSCHIVYTVSVQKYSIPGDQAKCGSLVFSSFAWKGLLAILLETPDHPVSKTPGYTVSETPSYTFSKTIGHHASDTRDQLFSESYGLCVLENPDHPVSKTPGYTVSETPSYTFSKSIGHHASDTLNQLVSESYGLCVLENPDHPVSKTPGYTVSETTGADLEDVYETPSGLSVGVGRCSKMERLRTCKVFETLLSEFPCGLYQEKRRLESLEGRSHAGTIDHCHCYVPLDSNFPLEISFKFETMGAY
ncbi:hypothetical protein J6590_048749 [Homalodisca vitripennis]|nr:hypothetical protein J6590_048749 [Homalodisca vitripennis]